MEEAAALPCAEKLVFPTEPQARAAAAVAKHRYGSRLRVYQCRHCGMWHIASDYGDGE